MEVGRELVVGTTSCWGGVLAKGRLRSAGYEVRIGRFEVSEAKAAKLVRKGSYGAEL